MEQERVWRITDTPSPHYCNPSPVGKKRKALIALATDFPGNHRSLNLRRSFTDFS
jgi:hypothetical protein